LHADILIQQPSGGSQSDKNLGLDLVGGGGVQVDVGSIFNASPSERSLLTEMSNMARFPVFENDRQTNERSEYQLSLFDEPYI